MDIAQLRYFVAVCEERSFTRAAQRCQVVQSALSTQVAKLEREHRTQLLERSNRGVAMTPAGEQLLARARRILAEVDEAVAEMVALRGSLTGVLRVGVINVVGQSAPRVDEALAAFHERHPAVEIRIHDPGSFGIIAGLRAGELDVGIVGLYAAEVPGEFAHHLISEHDFVAVVHRGHPLADRASVTPAELAAAGPAVELRAASGLRHYVDAAFDRLGVRRQVAFDVATTDEQIRYAALGMGFALVPTSATEPGQLRQQVAVLPVTGLAARHPVALVHRRPAPTSPAARALIAEILDRV
ncbi:LysR family transcriptional regulator [Granulicoccus phenolivorans]|uniref:LysR family transcriptional regulator n=1 Tax=Granulicoccus phenolivorans TaxID=266854 RepID=UPI000420465B|nr:LysR family transcriptional regulator [Granulicoccus phenolivorans]